MDPKDARSNKPRLGEQSAASAAEGRPEKRRATLAPRPQYGLTEAPRHHHSPTAQSEISGHGLQHSGPGDIAIGRDQIISRAILSDTSGDY